MEPGAAQGDDPDLDTEPRDDAPPWDLDHEPLAATLAPVAPPPAEGVAWAELPLRAGALLIDLAVASVIMEVIGRLGTFVVQNLLFLPSWDPDGLGGDPLIRGLAVLAPVVIAWLLVGGAATYLVRVYRATPGQMALGLFTVRRDGNRLSVAAAATRFVVLALGWLVSSTAGIITVALYTLVPWTVDDHRLVEAVALALPVAWYAVLTVTIVRDPRGRGLHDWIAGSVVVRRAGPPS